MMNRLAKLDVSGMTRAMKGRRDLGELRATEVARSCSPAPYIHSIAVPL